MPPTSYVPPGSPQDPGPSGPGHPRAGAARVDRLVQQLLTLARLEEAAGVTDATLDLGEVAQRVRAALAAQAEAVGVALVMNVPREPVGVRGSAEALDSMLTNLGDNAVRHGRPGARIIIRLRPEPSVLELVDDGPGLPPVDRERALARFHRPEGSSGQGSGLGLPIVVRVADLHNGSLALDAGDGASGLQVSVRLPGSPAPE